MSFLLHLGIFLLGSRVFFACLWIWSLFIGPPVHTELDICTNFMCSLLVHSSNILLFLVLFLSYLLYVIYLDADVIILNFFVLDSIRLIYSSLGS